MVNNTFMQVKLKKQTQLIKLIQSVHPKNCKYKLLKNILVYCNYLNSIY